MSIVVSVLIFIVCILLILVIMVQNSKGGGLSSTFAGSNQVMGVRKTTDFLEKATWTLAIALLFLSLVSAAIDGGSSEEVASSELQDFVNSEPISPPLGLPSDGAPSPISGGGGGNPK